MAYSPNTQTEKKKYAELKRRIASSQGQAKFLGIVYLLATVALTALACLQLVSVDGATLGVLEFWKPFLKFTEGGGIVATIKANIFELTVAALYAIMLLVLLINVIVSLSKLGWLFKKKASKLYGFNRNMYAMDDMGECFGSTFATVIVMHFQIALLAGGAKLGMLAYITLAVGIFVHFFAGMLAGNVSLYSSDDGVVEEKRAVGNFVPFIRNLLQIAFTAGVVYLFTQCSILRETLISVKNTGIKETLANPMELIIPALHLLIAIFTLFMVVYATSDKEFDPEGAKTPGRGWYLALSILLLLASAGAFVYGKFIKNTEVHNYVLFIAIGAFVMTVVEIIRCTRPKVKGTKKESDDTEYETGVFLSENYTEEETVYPAPFAFPPFPAYPQTVQTEALTEVQEEGKTEKKRKAKK